MRYREVASPVAGTEGAEAQESPSSPLPAAVLLLLFLRGFASSRLRVKNIGGTRLPDEPHFSAFCRFYCRFYCRFWLPLLLPFYGPKLFMLSCFRIELAVNSEK